VISSHFPIWAQGPDPEENAKNEANFRKFGQILEEWGDYKLRYDPLDKMEG
jgi:hypothetical protein